jgi:hypothetical protein
MTARKVRQAAYDEGQIAYYQGAYDQCRRLLTSPRMNRPQREVIEGEALRVKAELESRGVKFAPQTTLGP